MLPKFLGQLRRREVLLHTETSLRVIFLNKFDGQIVEGTQNTGASDPIKLQDQGIFSSQGITSKRERDKQNPGAQTWQRRDEHSGDEEQKCLDQH